MYLGQQLLLIEQICTLSCSLELSEKTKTISLFSAHIHAYIYIQQGNNMYSIAVPIDTLLAHSRFTPVYSTQLVSHATSPFLG